MFGALWASSLAIALALVAILALRLVVARWARGPKRATRVRLLAASRLVSGMFISTVAMTQLITSSSGLPPSVRWGLLTLAVLCLVPLLTNALAGLWLLSPFVNASPGDVLMACGRQGRITRYGLTGLELETDAGWTAHLPYIAIACRPLLVSRQHRALGTEFVLRRPGWTPEKVQFLRQALVLAPYRDVHVPVQVTLEQDVVSVRLSLAHPGAEALMQRFLELALERYETSAEHHRAEVAR